MNELSVFQNPQFGQVRIITRDGEPWFVANDVCRALDLTNPRKAISRLDADEKDGVTIRDAIGREQKTNAVNESGLYTLILTSRKPEAHAFKRWVTHDILPSIARTGKYENPNSPQTNGTITIDEDTLVRIGSVFCTETVKALLPYIQGREREPIQIDSPVQAVPEKTEAPKKPRKRNVPQVDIAKMIETVQAKTGLNYSKIASRCGIGTSTLSSWKMGICYPTKKHLLRFMLEFNISTDKLLEGVFD